MRQEQKCSVCGVMTRGYTGDTHICFECYSKSEFENPTSLEAQAEKSEERLEAFLASPYDGPMMSHGTEEWILKRAWKAQDDHYALQIAKLKDENSELAEKHDYLVHVLEALKAEVAQTHREYDALKIQTDARIEQLTAELSRYETTIWCADKMRDALRDLLAAVVEQGWHDSSREAGELALQAYEQSKTISTPTQSAAAS